MHTVAQVFKPFMMHHTLPVNSLLRFTEVDVVT
jgi:hypothetical protein